MPKQDGKLDLLSDAVFQAKLRNVLKDNAFDRRVKGRKRGKLDMRALYKVPAKVENIFTLKEARKNKHYNVVLIVDQSGSMQGGKQKKAAESAVFLARALERVGVNYSVIGFGGDWGYYKKFEQSANDETLQRLHFGLALDNRGGTDILPPLKEAFKVLRRTPDWQNIVITLTDGDPSNPLLVRQLIYGSRHVAANIDIGINSRPIMPNGIRIRGVNELKPLLLRELRQKIKRG